MVGGMGKVSRFLVCLALGRGDVECDICRRYSVAGALLGQLELRWANRHKAAVLEVSL